MTAQSSRVQRRVVRGARIVRFEQGKRATYSDGALIWLSAAELEKYQFIVEDVPVVSAKPAAQHVVRNGIPPAISSSKK